jgi:hypothetical protein
MLNLESSYQLLGIVRDDGIRTYRALELASGQGLQVHLFVRPEDQELFKGLRALPVAQRRDLLEFGQEGESPYVVTEKLPEGMTPRNWFLAKAGKAAAKTGDAVLLAGVWKTGTPLPEGLKAAAPEVKSPEAKQAPKPLPDYADATRVFRVSDLPKTPPPPESFEAPDTSEFERFFSAQKAEAPKVEPVPPPPAEPAEVEPGEFTRMFQAQAKAPAPPTPPPPPPLDEEKTRLFHAVTPEMIQPKPEEPKAEPGEFTRMFQAQAKTPAPPPGEQKREPSEFTRFFQSPLSPQQQERPQGFGMATPPPQAPPQPPPNRGGEFTQMFGGPKAAQGPPPPPLGSGSGGLATGAFAIPQSAPPLGGTKPTGPSEFTQMMSTGQGAIPTMGQRPQQNTPLPPPQYGGGKKSNAPLFIALGAVLLAVVLVVVMLMLRK